jgi:hypothetical protein
MHCLLRLAIGHYEQHEFVSRHSLEQVQILLCLVILGETHDWLIEVCNTNFFKYGEPQ